jgi:hypothetical protein
MLTARQQTAGGRSGAALAPASTWAAFVLYGDPVYTLPSADRSDLWDEPVP